MGGVAAEDDERRFTSASSRYHTGDISPTRERKRERKTGGSLLSQLFGEIETDDDDDRRSTTRV